jgi:hypothetical protein
VSLFFQLLALHFLCYFPLQGDFLARGKNHTTPLPGVPRLCCLLAHAFIHAGAYSLLVGWQAAGIVGAVHLFIDWCKSEGVFHEGKPAFWRDQAFHVLTLALLAIWVALP